MNYEYIREQSGNYMAIQGEKQTDCYEMKMVECNEINGLLSMDIRKVNNQSVYMYHISNKISMKDAFEHSLAGSKEINSFFNSLREALSSLQEYLLRPDGLILSAEHIFLDRTTKKAYFAYYENEEGDFFTNLKHLYEECILQCVDHKDSEAVTLVYGTYKKLCGNNCSIRGLFEFERTEQASYTVTEEKIENSKVMPQCVSEEKEEEDTHKKYLLFGAFGGIGCVGLWALISCLIPAIRIPGMSIIFYIVLLLAAGVGGFLLYRWYKENKQLFFCIRTTEAAVPYEERRVHIQLPKEEMNTETNRDSYRNTEAYRNSQDEWRDYSKTSSNTMNAMDTMEEEQGTMVLNSETMSGPPILRWVMGNQTMEWTIRKDIILGGASTQADCVISQPGVSRMHAKIICMEDRYFIKDLNSTNGTKVGDVLLVAFQLFPLVKNETIYLGNQPVEFIMNTI